MIDDEIELAGPRLAIQAAALLERAFRTTGLKQNELAAKLNIGEARVSQVIHGDGNFHLATLARFFKAMGFHMKLVVVDAFGEPLRIPGRVNDNSKRAGRSGGIVESQITYQHIVETDAGEFASFYSYAPVGVEGRHIDFPMKYEGSNFESNWLADLADLSAEKLVK